MKRAHPMCHAQLPIVWALFVPESSEQCDVRWRTS